MCMCPVVPPSIQRRTVWLGLPTTGAQKVFSSPAGIQSSILAHSTLVSMHTVGMMLIQGLHVGVYIISIRTLGI